VPYLFEFPTLLEHRCKELLKKGKCWYHVDDGGGGGDRLVANLHTERSIPLRQPTTTSADISPVSQQTCPVHTPSTTLATPFNPTLTLDIVKPGFLVSCVIEPFLHSSAKGDELLEQFFNHSN
jgi:hypothetical protein